MYCHLSVRAIAMDLCRYLPPLFLMFLSTNMFLTKAEQSKDNEDDRELGTNIMERAMDRSPAKQIQCHILSTLEEDFCQHFKAITARIDLTMDTVAKAYCQAMKSTKEQLCSKPKSKA